MTDSEAKSEEQTGTPEDDNRKKVETFYEDEEGKLKKGGIVIKFTVGQPPEEPFVFIRDEETGKELPIDTIYAGKPDVNDSTSEGSNNQ